MEHTALIIIDIQNIYFTEGDFLLYQPEQAAKNARKVLDYFRQEGMPVFHVKHKFGAGEQLEDIYDLVKPNEGECVIEKPCPNAFLNTSLQAELMKCDIKNLVVVGMMSHMCVDTTVRECQNYGYHVTVIEDACTTMNLSWQGKQIPATEVHQTFMASLNGAFAQVMSYGEWIGTK